MDTDTYEQIWTRPAEERTLAETNKIFAWIEDFEKEETNNG